MFFSVQFILFFLYIDVIAEEIAYFRITKKPSQAIKPGGKITISCTIAEKQSIIWHRKSGSLITKVANNGEIMDSFSKNRKYYLEKNNFIGRKYEERLSIDDNAESDWCQCIGRNGWL